MKHRAGTRARPESASWTVNTFPWLSAAGAVLLFVAWAVDSFFAAERAGTLHELDLLQSRVSTNEILKNQWDAVLLKERLLPEPDRLVTGRAALGYILFATNVMITAARAISPSTLPLDEQARRRRSLYETARTRFDAGDMEGVVSLALELQRLEHAAAPDLTTAFEKQYSALRAEEHAYRQGFLWIYVGGSILVAIGYLLRA